MKTVTKHIILGIKDKGLYFKKKWAYQNYGLGDVYEWESSETSNPIEAERWKSLEDLKKDYNVNYSIQRGEYFPIEVTETTVTRRRYKKI